MSEPIKKAVDMLNHMTEGKDVVGFLRTHFKTTCSLKTKVSLVKKMYLLQKSNNRHPDYVRTMRAFKNLVNATVIDSECKTKVDKFFNASFITQCKMHVRHSKKLICLGHHDLDNKFKKIKLIPNHLKTFKITGDESDHCRRLQMVARIEKNQSVLTIDGRKLLTWAHTIIKNAKISTSYPKLCCALLMVSGRRFAEIMNGHSKFEKAHGHYYGAIFTGQLKKQTEHPPYTIPLLIDFKSFDNALGVLRRKQGDVSALNNDEISVRYHSNVKKGLRKLLPEVESPHDLRGIYIKMAYEAFNFPKMTFARVAMLCLGHASLTESLAYNHIDLVNFDLKLGDFFLHV